MSLTRHKVHLNCYYRIKYIGLEPCNQIFFVIPCNRLVTGLIIFTYKVY